MSTRPESGGCPADYAGRMGETASAQRDSKVSELPEGDGNNGSITVKAFDRRFAKMSRKERQRLLQNRQGVGNEK